MRLLSDGRFAKNRDFFFRYYPYAIAASISAGFHYLCPGSRNMYTTTLKRLLYRQCVTILTGADCCAESVLAMRDQILPDEIDNDGDAAPSLPPLTVPDSDDDERSIEVDAFLEDHQDVESVPEVPAIIPASMASTIIFDGPPVEEEGELVAARRTGAGSSSRPGSSGRSSGGRRPQNPSRAWSERVNLSDSGPRSRKAGRRCCQGSRGAASTRPRGRNCWTSSWRSRGWGDHKTSTARSPCPGARPAASSRTSPRRAKGVARPRGVGQGDRPRAKKAFVRDLAQNMSNHRQGIGGCLGLVVYG